LSQCRFRSFQKRRIIRLLDRVFSRVDIAESPVDVEEFCRPIVAEQRKASAPSRRSYSYAPILCATAQRRLGSARRSSATRAESRSRWPRSRFRRTCSPDWTEARRSFLPPRARRGTMEPATRLRRSPIPARLAIVGGGIRQMSAWRFSPSPDRLRRGDGRRDAAIADFRCGWQFRICPCGRRRRQRDSGAPS
jgi:hypothetical protein